MAHTVARKLISSKVDSILPDNQSLPVCNYTIQEVLTCLKFFVITVVVLMYTKLGSTLALESPVQTTSLSISRLASRPLQKD